MASVLRPLSSFMLAAALLLGVSLTAPACSNQSEGERCDESKTGDSDCEAPLVCIRANVLLDPSSDRCCPSVSGEESDSRCTRRGLGTAGSGTGGGGGTGGSSTGGTPDNTGGTPDNTGGTPDNTGGTPQSSAGTPSSAGQGGTP